MYSEVCSLVAQGNIVGDQLGSGCVISQLESTIPSIVPEKKHAKRQEKVIVYKAIYISLPHEECKSLHLSETH